MVLLITKIIKGQFRKEDFRRIQRGLKRMFTLNLNASLKRDALLGDEVK